MRFESRMGLDLSHVAAFHYHVRILEALVRIAALFDRWPVDISSLGNIMRAATTAGSACLISRSRKNQSSIFSAGLVHIHHKRHWLVLDFNQRCSFLRRMGSGCGDSSYRLAGIANDGIFHLFKRWIAQHRAAHYLLDDMNSFDSRVLLGGGCIH